MRDEERNIPQLDVDLATFLSLRVVNDGVVELQQRGLHVVEALEFDEAATHGFARVLVGAETDLERLKLLEVLLDLLFCGAEGEVACRRQRVNLEHDQISLTDEDNEAAVLAGLVRCAVRFAVRLIVGTVRCWR